MIYTIAWNKLTRTLISFQNVQNTEINNPYCTIFAIGNGKIFKISSKKTEKKDTKSLYLFADSIRTLFPATKGIYHCPSKSTIYGSCNSQELNNIFPNKEWHLQFKYSSKKEKNFYERVIEDVNRYEIDQYALKVAFQETHSQISIGFQVNNAQIGIAGYVDYWHFNKKQHKVAQQTFETIKKIIDDIAEVFEYNRPPMAIISPICRNALQNVAIEHKERSGNYFFNWYQQLNHEADWRTTLYGNRYPVYQPESFNMAKQNEESKHIVKMNNNNPRTQYMKYINATQNTDQIAQTLSNFWRISLPVAMSFATWFISAGGNSQLLADQVSNGALPKDVVQSVQKNEKTTNQVTKIDSSEAKIAKLKPEIQQKIRNVLIKLKKLGWQPIVAEGLRTIEEQKNKIKGGFSKVKNPSASLHTQGLAADIVDQRYGWNGPAKDLKFKFWLDLGKIAAEEGLEWGGNWKSFKDVAHVQLTVKKSK